MSDSNGIKVGAIVFYKWGGDDPRVDRTSLIVSITNGFARLVYGTTVQVDVRYLRPWDALVDAAWKKQLGLSSVTKFNFAKTISRPVESITGPAVGNVTEVQVVLERCLLASAAARRKHRRDRDDGLDR